MTSDKVEESLRQAGRPEQPPDRLRRAVLGIPGDAKKPRSRRRLLIAGQIVHKPIAIQRGS